MPTIMVGRRQKVLKLNWLKCCKTARKKGIWTKKCIIQNLIFGVYFLNSDFLAERIKANKNKGKRSLILQYSIIKKTSLILKTLFHSALQKIYSYNTAKNLTHFTNFPENMFLVGFRKKDLHCTIFRCLRTILEALEKQISVYLFKPLLEFRKLLSGGGLNNFPKVARCLGLVKCFKVFHLD